MIKSLTEKQKAVILDAFIDQIHEINKGYGTVRGTYQILDDLEKIAIKKGFIECPCCGKCKK